MAQIVKNLPVMQETWVRPLVQEDPGEKAMATHSSILAWEIPEKPDRLQSMGVARSQTRLGNFHFSLNRLMGFAALPPGTLHITEVSMGPLVSKFGVQPVSLFQI